jgi:hypothetical protein
MKCMRGSLGACQRCDFRAGLAVGYDALVRQRRQNEGEIFTANIPLPLDNRPIF